MVYTTHLLAILAIRYLSLSILNPKHLHVCCMAFRRTARNGLAEATDNDYHVQLSIRHMINHILCFDLSQFCFAIVAPPGKVHKPSGQQKVILGWTDREKAVEAYQHFEEAIKNVPSPSIGQVDSMRHQVGQAASTLCMHPPGSCACIAEQRPAAAPTSNRM